MQQVSLSEAQERLLNLVNAALEGETIVIMRDAEHMVQLMPLASEKRKRKAGSAKGLISIAPDFDAPLPDFDEYTE